MAREEQSPQVCCNLLFPKIFQTFRMAIQPGKLAITFSALAIICLVGWIMDFSKTVVAAPETQPRHKKLMVLPETITELQIYLASPDQVRSYIQMYKERGERRGVFSTLWNFTSDRFRNILNSLFAFNLPAAVANTTECFKAVKWAFRYHFIYCIIFFVIKLAVISIAGGAICRMAALQFARGEKPGLTEALRFGAKKFTSFFAAPLAPIGIIIFTGLFILFLGLIGNIPRVGELTIGIFSPLALIAGFVITVILIGTVAGFNLMFPAVAYDGSDCFDVISRSFSYVYAKPWRMGFYTATAAVYGAICYTFVRFFAFLLLWVTRLFLQFGVLADNSNGQVNKLAAIWPEPTFVNFVGSPGLTTSNWSESVAAFLIYLAVLVIVGMVVSFLISFYFSANTIIYSLMRNSVDNTAIEEIYSGNISKTEPGFTENRPGKIQPEPEKQADASSPAEQQE